MSARTRRRPWLSIVLLALGAIATVALVLAWRGLASDDMALVEALVAGDPVSARVELARGGSPDARVDNGEHAGKTALMLAARMGDTVLVEAMIHAGAELDADNGRGGTALMYAATAGHLDTVDVLLRAGADVTRSAGNGWSALTLAVAKDHGEVVDRLIEAGADPDHPDVYRWTPLMRAAEQDNVQMMQRLLRHGADPSRTNDQGLDADAVLSLARSGLHVPSPQDG